MTMFKAFKIGVGGTIGVIAVVLLICGCCSFLVYLSYVGNRRPLNSTTQSITSTSSTENLPAPAPAPITIPKYYLNEEAPIGYARIKVTDVNTFNPSAYYESDAGNKCVYIDVLITNRGSENLSVNPLSFELRDHNSYAYEKTYFSCDKEPSLDSTVVAPGSSVRGFITFEVKQEGIAKEVVYQPNLFVSDSITISLEPKP